MRLSIVVPCYNEEKNIPLLLKRFAEVIKDNIEVIIVNNGSLDNSQTIINELLPLYAFARTVKVDVNQGYGYGILQGLEKTEGDYIGWTHADMQTDPLDVVKAFDIIRQSEKPCYIKGKRKGRSLFDVFFTFGMSIFETVYMRKLLYDINAQPNIFPRSFFESWTNPPYDFSLDLYALYIAKINDIEIKRFPVLFPKRIYGMSSWNTGLKSKWKFIKRTVGFSINLKKDLNRL